MANYCVSNLRGNDTTGTGTATNPWKTINKAVGSSPAITLSGSGDTLYIEPGIYREVVTLGLSPSSSSPLSIVGDCDGAGFLAGGYATPATGKVDWRAWSDDATPIAGATFSFTGKGYTTVRGVKIVGGTSNAITTSGDCPNWTFDDCMLVGPSGTVSAVIWNSTTAGSPLNLTFTRCKIYATTGNGVEIPCRYHTAEYDLGVLFENCLIRVTRWGVTTSLWGSATSFLPHGIAIRYCTFDANSIAFNCYQTVTGVTLATPNKFHNNRVYGGSNGAVGGNTSHVAENGNVYHCPTPLVNTTAGGASITSAPIAYDFDDCDLFGTQRAPYLTPSRTSAGVGVGDYSGSPPSVDLTGRPRPAGFGTTATTAGCYERHDTARKETTIVDAGGVGAALDGPGDQYLDVAVDAISTTISVKVRYDSNHGATTKPDVKLLAKPSLGVSSQTLTMTAAVDTWETLTFSAFTPTDKGVVRLQFLPHPAAASGIMFFDTLSVT